MTPAQLPEFPAKSAQGAAAAFRVSGAVILREVFSPDTITGWHQAFLAQYSEYLQGKDPKDALKVGAGRFKVSVALAPPFDTPDLFANPVILPIIRQVLDKKALLASMVCVAALPGAVEQHLHRDHPWLFGTPIDRMLPAFAVKVVVPLVPVGGPAGTTRVWPGSHVVYDNDAGQITPVEPCLSPGDVMLMDYRLMHQGTPNHGDDPRPVLFASYARNWFCDHENFDNQTRLSASPEFLETTAGKYAHLLQRLIHPN